MSLRPEQVIETEAEAEVIADLGNINPNRDRG